MSDAPRNWQAEYLSLFVPLIERRRTLGYSQKKLAAKVGVCPDTIQRWEASLRDPSAPELYRWAAALGVSIGFASGNVDGRSVDLPSIASIPLPSQQARVLEALLKAGKRRTSTAHIVDLLYGAEPNGGPDGATDHVKVLVSKLRRRLEPCGYGITNERNLGYRLTALEAA